MTARPGFTYGDLPPRDGGKQPPDEPEIRPPQPGKVPKPPDEPEIAPPPDETPTEPKPPRIEPPDRPAQPGTADPSA